MQRLFQSPQVLPLPHAATVSLEYHHHGNRDAREKILLVAGLWTTKEYWSPLLQSLLNNHYHVVTFDNRGVGGSDAPVER